MFKKTLQVFISTLCLFETKNLVYHYIADIICKLKLKTLQYFKINVIFGIVGLKMCQTKYVY